MHLSVGRTANPHLTSPWSGGGSDLLRSSAERRLSSSTTFCQVLAWAVPPRQGSGLRLTRASTERALSRLTRCRGSALLIRAVVRGELLAHTCLSRRCPVSAANYDVPAAHAPTGSEPVYDIRIGFREVRRDRRVAATKHEGSAVNWISKGSGHDKFSATMGLFDQ